MDELRSLQTVIQEIRTLLNSKSLLDAHVSDELIRLARDRMWANGESGQEVTLQAKKMLATLSLRISALGDALTLNGKSLYANDVEVHA